MPAIQGCVRANLSAPILLGRQGENNARQVTFDIGEWRTRFGESGIIKLYHKRPKDAMAYGVPVEMAADGMSVTWTVSEVDTDEAAHYGQAELQYISQGRIVKSELYRTEVYACIGDFVPKYPGVMIGDDGAPRYEIIITYVGELPEIGEEKRLYMVPTNSIGATEDNRYDKFVWIEAEKRYERIGSPELTTDYDEFNRKMSNYFYSSSHVILYGRFISPSTNKIAYIWCLEPSLYERQIRLTFISEEDGAMVQTPYYVRVNKQGVIENDGSLPYDLSDGKRVLIYAEQYDAIRNGREIAHNPLRIRVDYKRSDEASPTESFLEFLNTVGIERTFQLVSPKPTTMEESDEYYIQNHSDDEVIWAEIGADSEGNYYTSVTVIPEDFDIYTPFYSFRE